MKDDVQATVIAVIQGLLERSNKEHEVTLDTRIHGDDGLGLDSLETAELSALLEDELETDPFGAGLMPETVAEIVGFYEPGAESVATLTA